MARESLTKVSDDYMREYNFEILKARIFGAILSAIEFRKEEGLTIEKFAKLLNKSEEDVRKLIEEPDNWNLSTIADLMFALNLQMEFSFVDRANFHRQFIDSGRKEIKWRN